MSLLSRALHAAERTGELDLVGRAYVARARVRGMLADYRLAWGDARAGLVAARQAGDRRLEMAALQESGFDTAVALGVPIDEVAATLRDALGIAESLGDRAAEAVLLARLAVNTANRLQFGEALTLGLRAAAAGRASGQDQALASGLHGLRAALAYPGDPAPLTEVLAELQPLQRRLGDLAGLEWSVFESAFPSIGVGDWDLARDRILEAIEINRRSEFVAGRAFYLAHLGWVERLQGSTDQAVRHGRDAVPTRGADQPRVVAPHRGRDARGHADRSGPTRRGRPAADRRRVGDPARAAGGSPAALPRPAGRGHRFAVGAGARPTRLLRGITGPVGSAWLLGADCYLAVARAWLDRDEPARARAVLTPLLSAAERLTWVPALAGGCLVDGRAAAALGDHAAAGALIGRAVTLVLQGQLVWSGPVCPGQRVFVRWA